MKSDTDLIGLKSGKKKLLAYLLLSLLMTQFQCIQAQEIKTLTANDIFISQERREVYFHEWIEKAKISDIFPGVDDFKNDTLLEHQILFIRPSPNNPFKEEQNECELRFLKIFREINGNGELDGLSAEAKSRYIKEAIMEESPSCFYFYRKLAPVLVFQIDHGFGSEGLLTNVEAEILLRTNAQASGTFSRPADSDLLLPAEGMGWVECLDKNKPGYRSVRLAPGVNELKQLIWSESYHHSMVGKLPGRETFLLRLKFTFIGSQSAVSQVYTPFLIIQI